MESKYAGLEAAAELVTQLKGITGDKTALNTIDKSNLVAAINELFDAIFDYATTKDMYVENSATITRNVFSTTVKSFKKFSDNTLLALIQGNPAFTDANLTSMMQSTDGGYTWSTVNFNYNIADFCILSDDTIVLVTEGNGIWYSTDKGITWTMSTYNQYASGYFIFATSNDTIILASKSHGSDYTGKGILYSTDKGVTWTQSNLTSNITYYSYAVSSNNIVISGNGLWYSTDEGVTWTQSNVTSNVSTVKSINNNVLIAGVNSSGLWYSTDEGVTWTQSDITSGSIDNIFSTSNAIFAFQQGYSTLYKSINNGITWTTTTFTRYIYSAAVMPNNDIAVFTFLSGYTIPVYYSTDEGGTWNYSKSTIPVYSTPDVVAVINNIVILHCGSNIYLSTDYCTTWVQANLKCGLLNKFATFNNTILASSTRITGIWYSTDNGITYNISNVENVYVNKFIIVGDTVIADTDSQYNYKSTDGITWSEINTTPTNMNVYSAANNVLIGINIYYGTYGLYYSTDKGNTWTQSNITSGVFRDVAMTSNGTLIALGSTGIYYSTDNGITWTQSNITSTSASPGDKIIISSDNHIVAFVSRFIYLSSDGITWTTNNISTATKDMTVTTDNTFIRIEYYGHIERSTDNGSTWTQVQGTPSEIKVITAINEAVVLGGTNGVYYSFDDGLTFNTLINEGIPNVLSKTGDTTVMLSTSKAIYTCSSQTIIDPSSLKPKWETAIEELAAQLNA